LARSSARKARLNWRGLEIRRGGELSDRQWLVEVCVWHKASAPWIRSRLGLKLEQRRKLRLATGPPVIDHSFLAAGAGQGPRPKILLDHGQHEVDAGGHPAEVQTGHR